LRGEKRGNRFFVFFVIVFLLGLKTSAPKWDTTSGITIQKINDIGLFEEVTSIEKSNPRKTMQSGGIEERQSKAALTKTKEDFQNALK